jgi:hypothetical protein
LYDFVAETPEFLERAKKGVERLQGILRRAARGEPEGKP